jgi:hypothetical protein
MYVRQPLRRLMRRRLGGEADEMDGILSVVDGVVIVLRLLMRCLDRHRGLPDPDGGRCFP